MKEKNINIKQEGKSECKLDVKKKLTSNEFFGRWAMPVIAIALMGAIALPVATVVANSVTEPGILITPTPEVKLAALAPETDDDKKSETTPGDVDGNADSNIKDNSEKTSEPTEPTKTTADPDATAAATDGNTKVSAAPYKELCYGDDSSRMITVQERLMKLGYMENDEPTSHFGPITYGAVQAFQRQHEFKVTGVIDKATYDMLMSSDAQKYMVFEGATGEDVRNIQSRLYEMAYLKTEPTGYFGSTTREAVESFQSRNKLGVDGKVGEETKELLFSEDAVPNMWSAGSSGELVLKYQKRLFDLGYLTSEPDGQYGDNTVTAVKRFQEKNGLTADGYLGATTISVLMSDDAVPNSLTIGSSGKDVYSVQNRLYKLGYLYDNMTTGYFGTTTAYAVRAFQKQNSLSIDGRVGKKTMSVLMSNDAKKAPSGYKPYTGDSDDATPKPTKNSDKSTPNPTKDPGESDSSTPSKDKFISAAISRLGCKYVRGAKGPKQFDCSGLVYWCLQEAGVKQSYLTSYNWRSVTKYKKIKSLDDVRSGDVLVFYGHVGIAINSSEMVDASSTEGCVVRRSCKGKWCRNEFICAFRVFG